MTARVLYLAGLYVSEGGHIKRLIQRIVRNRTTSEDLLQDAFVKLIGQSAPSLIKNEKAYLAQVARNLAIDHRRAEKVIIGLDEADIFALADPSPSAEKALADRQELKITLEVIAALPEKTRRVFEMHRLGENTLSEIAGQLDISTAHAGRLVMAGYKAVRDELRSRDTN